MKNSPILSKGKTQQPLRSHVRRSQPLLWRTLDAGLHKAQPCGLGGLISNPSYTCSQVTFEPPPDLSEPRCPGQ